MLRSHPFSRPTASERAVRRINLRRDERGTVTALSLVWMCTTMAGVLVVAHAGTTMLSHQRVRHCADALALAVAVGNPVAVTALSRELRCRIVERSVSDGVVTVTVRSPWGTASASASSGV